MYAKRGFTLIELIIAIMIIGVGVAGLMVAFSNTVRTSANPLQSKQIVAIAEEMMEEVLLKPYNPANVAVPAPGTFACGTPGANREAFDHVLDYNGYQTTGICDASGTAAAGLGNYNLAITAVTLGGNWQGIAGVAQITVTVTRGADAFTLTNWRTP